MPDVIVAAAVGLVTGWCFGPLLPVVGHWLAKSSILQFLLQVIVLALALSSQFFPYSPDAPKRVILQHKFVTTGLCSETSVFYSSICFFFMVLHFI